MGKKKRLARRGVGSGETFTERFEMRLRATEKQAFLTAAELAGLEMADWVRERLRRAARQELEEAQQPIPFIKPPKMD
ncbi:MAG: hypothetical protein ACJ8C4_08275 [Gemmataceae bacterium]